MVMGYFLCATHPRPKHKRTLIHTACTHTHAWTHTHSHFLLRLALVTTVNYQIIAGFLFTARSPLNAGALVA